MNVQRAETDRRGNITGNINIDYLEDAEKFDSVFLELDEIEDANFLEGCNSILATKGFTLVIGKAKKTKSGNYRTFIGDKDYVRPRTLLRRPANAE